jgi:hypothetical protein
MRILFLSGNESTWLVTYTYCGYKMCRYVVASDEKGAEAEIRRSINIDRIVNVEECAV